MAPSSPPLKRRPKRSWGGTAIPGLRVPPREKPLTGLSAPVERMSLDELRDRYKKNEHTLRTMSAPTSSSFIARLAAEQHAVKTRLAILEEAEGDRLIQGGLRNISLLDSEVRDVEMGEEESISASTTGTANGVVNGSKTSESSMEADQQEDPPPGVSRSILAKQKALAAWGTSATSSSSSNSKPKPKIGLISLSEAMELSKQAYALEQEQLARAAEKRARKQMPRRADAASRAEFEARMWAFMNYKPSESDLEDEDDDDDDPDDPATWFDDDQDDGRKGQDIVYPDADDLVDIIRVDESRFPADYLAETFERYDHDYDEVE